MPPAPGAGDGQSDGQSDGQGNDPPRRAHYYLSVRGGFVQPFVGMRVVVAYESPAARARPNGGHRDGDSDDDDDDNRGGKAPPLAASHPAFAADAAARQAAAASAALAMAAPVKGPAGAHDPAGADPWAGRKTYGGRVVRCHGGKGQVRASRRSRRSVEPPFSPRTLYNSFVF
jgi:hypothetical protein